MTITSTFPLSAWGGKTSMKESKLHASQWHRQNSPHYRENLFPEKENTTDIIFHHWPLSPAGFHLKTLQLSPVSVTGHSLSKANVLLGYHRHSASQASTHTVTQKIGGHKYILKETPSCRRAAPWAHTQYILIKELSLGPENFWILMHLKLIQPAQTQTWCKLLTTWSPFSRWKIIFI